MPDPFAVLRLYRIVRRERPDIIHSFLLHANIVARLCRLLYWVPVQISSQRTTNEGSLWRYVAYRITDGLSDVTTHVSDEGARVALERRAVALAKMRVIPNGIELSRYRRRPDGSRDSCFRWIAVGRCDVPKGYPYLLRAFKDVCRRYPTAQLWIVGHGPLADELRLASASMGLEASVTFLGLRRDVSELLSVADAFVLASLWEGMPNALLEAAATGLPCVATHVGGVDGIIPDRSCGIVVPPGDEKSLASAMLEIMRMPAPLRDQMGNAIKSNVAGAYSLSRVVSQWEQLYQEYLRRSGR
jgi:glycosyltransferase involved in cell wall biosynthesis